MWETEKLRSTNSYMETGHSVFSFRCKYVLISFINQYWRFSEYSVLA